MATLDDGLVELFGDPQATKVLGTVDEQGVPHVVAKGSLTVLDDGYIAYAEGSDSSQTNKNMVRSIWFDRPVSITVVKGRTSYQIKGRPYKCVITGPLFQQFLARIRERLGPDADIQSVWIVKPEEVRLESPSRDWGGPADGLPSGRHLEWYARHG